MSESTYRKLCPNDELEESDITIVQADKRSYMSTLGRAKKPITLQFYNEKRQKVFYQCRPTICRNLQLPLILSNQDLVKLKLVVRLHEKRAEITVNDKLIYVPLVEHNEVPRLTVSAVRNTKVEPFSEAIIEGVIETDRPKGQLVEFVPNQEFQEKYGLLCCSSLDKVRQGNRIRIRVANFSDEPVTVTKHVAAGEVIFCTERNGKVYENEALPCKTGKTKVPRPVLTVSTGSRKAKKDAKGHKKPTEISIDELRTRLVNDLKLKENTSLTDSEKIKLVNLFIKYSKVLALEYRDIGDCKLFEVEINTGDAKPIKHRMRPAPTHLKADLRAQLDRWLTQGVIEHCTGSWAACLVPVGKPDGSIRWCADFRSLNKVIKPDARSVPSLPDKLRMLKAGRRPIKCFTTIDLSEAFHSLSIKKEDREKAAFITEYGLFQFARMPFGLSMAPNAFCHVVQNLEDGLHAKDPNLATRCLAYFDDIILASEDFDELYYNLESLLQQLERLGLKIKPSKVSLSKPSVTWLGVEITPEGQRPCPKRTAALRNWKRPNDLTSARKLSGYLNIFRKWIRGYASRTNHIVDLTKQENPKWDKKCEAQFRDIVDTICKSPLLRHADFSENSNPFIVTVDSSSHGIGSTLSQIQQIKDPDGNLVEREVIISYASRRKKAGEMHYGSYKSELLGVVDAVHHFKEFLLGKRFTIRSDNKGLKWLTDSTSDKMPALAQRWKEMLSPYDFEIEWAPATSVMMRISDGLSRKPYEHYDFGEMQPAPIRDEMFPFGDLSPQDASGTSNETWSSYFKKSFKNVSDPKAAKSAENRKTAAAASLKRVIKTAKKLASDCCIQTARNEKLRPKGSTTPPYKKTFSLACLQIVKKDGKSKPKGPKPPINPSESQSKPKPVSMSCKALTRKMVQKLSESSQRRSQRLADKSSSLIVNPSIRKVTKRTFSKLQDRLNSTEMKPYSLPRPPPPPKDGTKKGLKRKEISPSPTPAKTKRVISRSPGPKRPKWNPKNRRDLSTDRNPKGFPKRNFSKDRVPKGKPKPIRNHSLERNPKGTPKRSLVRKPEGNPKNQPEPRKSSLEGPRKSSLERPTPLPKETYASNNRGGPPFPKKGPHGKKNKTQGQPDVVPGENESPEVIELDTSPEPEFPSEPERESDSDTLAEDPQPDPTPRRSRAEIRDLKKRKRIFRERKAKFYSHGEVQQLLHDEKFENHNHRFGGLYDVPQPEELIPDDKEADYDSEFEGHWTTYAEDWSKEQQNDPAVHFAICMVQKKLYERDGISIDFSDGKKLTQRVKDQLRCDNADDKLAVKRYLDCLAFFRQYKSLRFNKDTGILHRVRIQDHKHLGAEYHPMVIPQHLRRKVLIATHDALSPSFHRGNAITMNTLKRYAYWPNMEQDVRKYILNCGICQDKYRRHDPELGRTVSDARDRLVFWSTDVIYMPDNPWKWTYMVTFTDLATRYMHAFPMKLQTTEAIAEGFREMTDIHGPQLTFESDNAPAYRSYEMRQVVGALRCKLRFKARYNPKSLYAERRQGLFKSYLNKLLLAYDYHESNWTILFKKALFYVNHYIDESGSSAYYRMTARQSSSFLTQYLNMNPGNAGPQYLNAEEARNVAENRMAIARTQGKVPIDAPPRTVRKDEEPSLPEPNTVQNPLNPETEKSASKREQAEKPKKNTFKEPLPVNQSEQPYIPIELFRLRRDPKKVTLKTKVVDGPAIHAMFQIKAKALGTPIANIAYPNDHQKYGQLVREITRQWTLVPKEHRHLFVLSSYEGLVPTQTLTPQNQAEIAQFYRDQKSDQRHDENQKQRLIQVTERPDFDIGDIVDRVRDRDTRDGTPNLKLGDKRLQGPFVIVAIYDGRRKADIRVYDDIQGIAIGETFTESVDNLKHSLFREIKDKKSEIAQAFGKDAAHLFPYEYTITSGRNKDRKDQKATPSSAKKLAKKHLCSQNPELGSDEHFPPLSPPKILKRPENTQSDFVPVPAYHSHDPLGIQNEIDNPNVKDTREIVQGANQPNGMIQPNEVINTGNPEPAAADTVPMEADPQNQLEATLQDNLGEAEINDLLRETPGSENMPNTHYSVDEMDEYLNDEYDGEADTSSMADTNSEMSYEGTTSKKRTHGPDSFTDEDLQAKNLKISALNPVKNKSAKKSPYPRQTIDDVNAQNAIPTSSCTEKN